MAKVTYIGGIVSLFEVKSWQFKQDSLYSQLEPWYLYVLCSKSNLETLCLSECTG